MQLIETLNSSGFFAQSAFSAERATKDSLGNDITATYLSAHQDLSNYATKTEVESATSGLQPAGSYLSANALDSVSGDWNEVSAKLDTTAFSDVSGSFLTAVPDTYLQNTDLSTTDGKITAISGLPLSAGGEVPEGVMVESGLEYNAVNEISGYNGSAIAQYGAEKQWLTHDDTIVSISNSAQYAFGVALPNISADLARMMGVDETVLWESTAYPGTIWLSATFNEPVSAFNKIKFYSIRNALTPGTYNEYLTSSVLNNKIMIAADTWTDNNWYRYCTIGTLTNTSFIENTAFLISEGSTARISAHSGAWLQPIKIVGIGRKN